MDYRQPDFYHFDEDSIFLATYIAKSYSEGLNLQVLDLCAGSGIIGVEFVKKTSSSVEQLDFLELQREFYPYIQENVKNFLDEKVRGEIYIDDLKGKKIGEYDIILCNPPYFNQDNFRVSSNLKKRRCRFLLNMKMNDIFTFFENNLKREGRAFFLTRKKLSETDSLKKELKSPGAFVYSYSL